MDLRAGRYEILRPIASGGMAQVHLGRAVGAGGFERQVAIKTMHPHLAKQEDFVAMFLDEARLSARVHHPNVVATLDVQQDDEGIFLVMDYVDGFSLHAILAASRAEGRPLPLGLTLRIFLDTLAGLHAAHELTDGGGVPLEVIHRDVSPHNILVGVDGAARLTDFGIARAAVRLAATSDGNMKGKLRYMAPEQLGSGKLDRRADLHAAGAVLWEMLAGVGLVRGENEGVCLMQIARPEKESPRAHNPDVPGSLAAACLGALRLHPEERYATAAAFAEAIEDAAAEAGILVASPREVAALVRALKAGDLAAPSPLGNSGPRTAMVPGLGPPTVTTPATRMEIPRAEPRSRRKAPVVAMAILVAGAAVLATVMLTRAPASVQAGASTVTAAVTPAAPVTSAPAPSSGDQALQAPRATVPPPSAAPPSKSPPPRLRPIPGKPVAPFRPREL